MSEKPCPKSYQYENTKQVIPPETLILLHGIGQTLSSILSPNEEKIFSVLI